MALDKIPGPQLFSQRDVRETPTSTATATAVGLTDESYILAGAGGADLTAERVLTAGEGIDFDDAGAGSTFTINGEDATTTNKGIASFNTDDFTISSGAVSLKNKTSYWSCTGTNFFPEDPSELYRHYIFADGMIFIADENFSNQIGASVNLPHGAVVTGVIVKGTDTLTWKLRNYVFGTGEAGTMASESVGTEDTTISNATINNLTTGYYFEVSAPSVNNYIQGAIITYTTDYI